MDCRKPKKIMGYSTIKLRVEQQSNSISLRRHQEKIEGRLKIDSE